MTIGEVSNIGANPYNFVRVDSAEEAGNLVRQRMNPNRPILALAGYSAPPPGYADGTLGVVRAIGNKTGTGVIVSPTAAPGSIDAIGTEASGIKNGKLGYVTAEGFTEYVSDKNLPSKINRDAYLKEPKFVLPDPAKYSKATALASDGLLVSGGRNQAVLDAVNAVMQGNKVAVFNNEAVQTTAWDFTKGRVNNASKYLKAQVGALRKGKPLPFPVIEELKPLLLKENAGKLELFKVVNRSSKGSIQAAANKIVQFLKEGKFLKYLKR